MASGRFGNQNGLPLRFAGFCLNFAIIFVLVQDGKPA